MAPVLPDDRPPAPAVARPRPTPATILARAAVAAAIAWVAGLSPANPFNRQADLRTAAEPIPVAGVRDAGERNTRFLPVALNHFERGIRPIGQIGGEVSAVALAGRFAFAGVGPRLVAIDLADPARPVEVGRSEPAAGRLTDIEVAGGYAFATAQVQGDDINDRDPAGGLRVFDVRDPSRPRLVGQLNTPDGVDAAIDVAGSYAYIAELWGGLRIVDVSTPERPVLVGAVGHEAIDGVPFDVAAIGDHVIVANWEYRYSDFRYGKDGLLIVDVSNPASPRPVGFLGGRPRGLMAPSGSRLFVAIDGRGIWILDVALPASPRLVGTVADPGATAATPGGWIGQSDAMRATTDGTLVVAHRGRDAAGAEGIHWRWVDIRDPARPREIATHWLAAVDGFDRFCCHGLVVDARLAITIDGRGALGILSGIDHRGPRFVGEMAPGPFERVEDIAVGGAGLAFLAADDYPDALHALDFQDPARPRIVGTLWGEEASDWGGGIAEHRGHVFVSADDGLHVIDARTPAAMREVARLAVGGGELALAGGFLYLASLSDIPEVEDRGPPGGLRVIDARDPTRPREVGYAPGEMTAVAADGRTIWVGSICDGRFGQTACLQAYDVSAPERPTLVGQYNLPFVGTQIEDIEIGRGFAFVTTSGGSDWYVLDIGDPSRIRLVKAYEDSWGARLALDGTTLFLAGGGERLRAYDIRDPAHIREAASYTMSDPDGYGVTDVAVTGGVVLAGTGGAGLWLFDARDFSSAR